MTESATKGKEPKTVEARLARLEGWFVCLAITLLLTMFVAWHALGKTSLRQELISEMVKHALLSNEAEQVKLKAKDLLTKTKALLVEQNGG